MTAQEFVFRSYFFWRYESLAEPVGLIALNVLAFGWVHIIFRSWISVVVTAVGGFFFAELFVQYHSLLGVCIVHLACGLSIFAMGLGRYFYTGSVRIAREIGRKISTVS